MGLFSPLRDLVPNHLVAHDANMVFAHTPSLTSAHHAACCQCLQPCRALSFPCCRSLCTMKPECRQGNAQGGGPQPTKEGALVTPYPSFPAARFQGGMTAACSTLSPMLPGRTKPQLPTVVLSYRTPFTGFSSSPCLPSPLPRVGLQVTCLCLNPCLWVNFWKNSNQDNLLCIFLGHFLPYV